MNDLRYLKSESVFLEYSFLSLQSQFDSRKDFNSFYSLIGKDIQKNLFLKTASFYLFLVKKGDWLVNINSNPNKRIDYLTNTYKYIAVFSLIESLGGQKYIDFYEYLIRCNSNIKFPIINKSELDQYYLNYKNEFGSIRKSVNFFKSLKLKSQKTLLEKLEIKNTNPTIENLSKYLYDLRSKFVHEAELIVNISGHTIISKKGNNTVICKLSIKDLMQFFEESLITYFRCNKS